MPENLVFFDPKVNITCRQRNEKYNEGVNERFVDAAQLESDEEEVSLRPTKLDQFIGQDRVKRNLATFLEAAKKRDPKMLGKGEGILDHILFYGPPGLGKTTLAVIVASELGVSLKRTTGKSIERAGDVAAILTSLSDGDVLFVDEIHRLNPQIEETFYSAMEDFRFDIVLGKGPSARTITLPLNRFTLIGATTRVSLLSSPLRDRFGIIERLDYYTHADLAKVALRGAKALGIEIGSDISIEVAKRGRGTPRIVLRLLRRARDFAQVQGLKTITKEVLEETFKALEVNEFGLDKMDRRLMETMITRFNGGPVGLDTMAAILGEDRDTVEDVIEPFLLQEGMLERTPRGRVILDRGYQACGMKAPNREVEPYLF